MSKNPYPFKTLPEIIGASGLLTDGDWVESKDQDPTGGVRLTQLADVGDGEFRDRSDRWMNGEQAQRLNVTYLQPGDVLIARMPDPLGRACVCPRLPTPAVTVVDVCIVRAPEHNPNWIMFAVNAPQARTQIASFQAGSTRKRISKKNLSTIPLPMPGRSEQDLIVAEIEKQFTRLDAAVATLKRVQANLERARASVLKAAVEGRLVPTEAELARTEGRVYEPASVLLERILEERIRKHDEAQAGAKRKAKYKPPVAPDVEELPELPEGWTWASVDQLSVAPLANGRSVPTLDSGFPVLRLTAMRNGRVDFAEAKGGKWTEDEASAWTVQHGDFFVMRGNGSISRVGSAAIAENPPRRVAFPDTMIRLQLPTHLISARYLLCIWSAPFFRAQIEGSARTTAGIYKVNQSAISAYAVPLPPSHEQARIAVEVERRASVLDALEAAVTRNLARCERLRQSILKRAFEGKLVPQDPNDEPASELLARIQAQTA